MRPQFEKLKWQTKFFGRDRNEPGIAEIFLYHISNNVIPCGCGKSDGDPLSNPKIFTTWQLLFVWLHCATLSVFSLAQRYRSRSIHLHCRCISPKPAWKRQDSNKHTHKPTDEIKPMTGCCFFLLVTCSFSAIVITLFKHFQFGQNDLFDVL